MSKFQRIKDIGKRFFLLRTMLSFLIFVISTFLCWFSFDAFRLVKEYGELCERVAQIEKNLAGHVVTIESNEKIVNNLQTRSQTWDTNIDALKKQSLTFATHRFASLKVSDRGSSSVELSVLDSSGNPVLRVGVENHSFYVKTLDKGQNWITVIPTQKG